MRPFDRWAAGAATAGGAARQHGRCRRVSEVAVCAPAMANRLEEQMLGEQEDDDIPQLPVIVPGTVQGGIATSPPPAEPLNGEVPAVVSITRVPAKTKTPEETKVAVPGIKVRTDLGPPPRTGPPPLLRVAGPPRPALPPMPRLKLGGQRAPAPAPKMSTPYSNGWMQMVGSIQQSQRQSSPRSQMMMGQMFNQALSQPQQLGLPVIAGTMSLKQLRPKTPGPNFSPRGIPQGLRPSPKASARPPFTPTSRPLQVRTVFVPPPMRMKTNGSQPHKPMTSPGPKVISSFPMNIPGLATPISITPLSNGKTHGQGKSFLKYLLSFRISD